MFFDNNLIDLLDFDVLLRFGVDLASFSSLVSIILINFLLFILLNYFDQKKPNYARFTVLPTLLPLLCWESDSII